MTHAVAFIGTGDPDGDGFAMAHAHADGYRRLGSCDLLACADVARENAEGFAAEYGIDDDHVYEDYEEMLAEAAPDVVSVCVPPAVHAPAVLASVRTESVEAVHCEKPMAPTWGECREMALEAQRRGVQLTFGHQRRFGPEWRRAEELLDGGEIGELRRIETAAPNLFDWGTHCLDLCGMFVDEAAPEWVLGNVDVRRENRIYGVHHESQAAATWRYETGVFGLISTGGGAGRLDCGLVDCLHRLEGTDGAIEVYSGGFDADSPVRLRRAGESEWTGFEFEAYDDLVDPVAGAIEHAMDALEEGFEPEIGATNALHATELIFGIYESARRRGRVDFPLEIDDHPLEAMIEAGELSPGGD